jgi:hypothetical protein
MKLRRFFTEHFPKVASNDGFVATRPGFANVRGQISLLNILPEFKILAPFLKGKKAISNAYKRHAPANNSYLCTY